MQRSVCCSRCLGGPSGQAIHPDSQAAWIAKVEPPTRAAGEPLGPIPPDIEGKPAPVQFDAPTQYRVDRLTNQYGNVLVPDPDGEPDNTISVSQLTQLLQQELVEADAMVTHAKEKGPLSGASKPGKGIAYGSGRSGRSVHR